MYGHDNYPAFPRADYLLLGGGDDHGNQLMVDQFSGLEMGSPSSLASCGGGSMSQGSLRPSFMQRSVSSHSLDIQRNANGFSSPRCHPFASPAYQELLELDTATSVRRAFSAGDLQHGHSRAESPLSSESSAIIESMNRASKYSPEEKKERIERYRSKRTQRNFNKKIKYECRKTLADSRPRIRGRFARNDEIIVEKIPDHQLQWSNMSGEEDEEDDDTWIINTFLDPPFSANPMA